MENLINEKTLKEKGFILNTKCTSYSFKMYEKDTVVLEAPYTLGGTWTLRERIDTENSKYIGDVRTWDDVAVFNCF